MFRDRSDAGRQLAQAVTGCGLVSPLVLALPRGGVVVGAEVATALQGDLDVLLVKKLRTPDNPELALGAVAEDGRAFWNPDVLQLTSLPPDRLARERADRLAELETQRRQYRAARPRVDPRGRELVLVDDGLATGATMIAAVQAVSLAKPARVIVASPVAPPDTFARIRELPAVHDVICLHVSPWFSGVGQFYEDFTQVPDATVIAILRRFAS